MSSLWVRLKPLAESFLAALLGFGIGAVLMLLWGFDPIKAYSTLFQGSLADFYGIADTLTEATPLILTGLTFAIGIRTGLFNIGAQGQVCVGAVAAVVASLFALPWELHLPLSLVFAMAAGALWSLPVALLKATRGVHEVISTIMLNAIGLFLSRYLASAWLAAPDQPQKTIAILPSAQLSRLWEGTDLTTALFISLLFAGFVYWVLWHTALGYEIRAVGLNPDASRYGGISPALTIGVSFTLGGLAAGLAGATQVLGRSYALNTDLSNVANLGFDGIAVALVGRNHPLGVIGAAIFMGALAAGSHQMQISAGVSLEMIRVVQGAIILTLAVPELLNLFRIFRLRRAR